jgi:hypothetical protein
MRRTVLLCLAFALFTTIKAQINVKIGNVSGAEPGTIIHVPVSVSGLDAANGGTPVTAMELHISYTDSYLVYDSTLNFNSILPSTQWFFGTTGSEYATNWIEPNLNAMSIPDNTILFEVAFMYLGGNTTLEFVTSKCEFLDASYNKIEGVQYSNGNITPSSGSEISKWNGTGPWNTAANWSNGIPGEGTIALTETGSLMIESNAVCRMLSIASGSTVNVLPGFSLTIDSLLVNDGSFLVSSDETGTGSVIVNKGVSGSGIFNCNQWMDFSNGKKHMISSPVGNTSVSSIPNVIFEKYNENTASWVQLNSGESLTQGTGYRASGSAEQLITFSGMFPVTDILISGLSFSNTSNDKNKGLNLIGNPFPSAIAWNQGNWIKTNIDHSIYCWDNYKYICWNGSVGSLNNGIIPPLQGFFVHANALNAQITLPAGSRIHSDMQFLKTELNTDDLLIVKIEKDDDPDHFDEAFIQISEGTSLNFDGSADAYKLFGNDSYPQVYTRTADNMDVAINTQPSYQSLPLICKVSQPGNYKLSFSNLGSFNPGQALTLEDKSNNSFINLRNINSYLFVSDGSTETDRFNIHFYEVGLEDEKHSDLSILFHQGSLQVLNPGNRDEIDQIRVYDMSGKEISIVEDAGFNTPVVIGELPAGLYLVRLMMGRNVISKKLVVN